VAADAVVAGNDTQSKSLWRLREAISPAQKIGGVSLKHDISVPVAAIPSFVVETCGALERAVPGIRPCVFGHVGDGNLHFNLSQPEGMSEEAFRALEADCNRIVFDAVGRYRGSIAAEHGIGRLRADELLRRGDAVRLDLMRRLKASLDPEGLLNPGKVLAPDAGAA
jgi:FAD/FMN-containing dehydrogenase